MLALSIQQPFASLIINGWKDKEHRTWNTDFRGRFIVHASKRPYQDFMQEYGFRKEAFEYGVILGTVELYDVKVLKNNIKAFLLKKPIKFPTPIPYKGQLKFFDIPDDVLKPQN